MSARERIFIIPRWTGLFFGVLVILIFATGFVLYYARPLTQTLGVTLVVAGVVALIQSNENLRGIRITGSRSNPVPAGDEALIELTVRNVSDRERIGLLVRTGWKVLPRLSTWVPVLEPGESTTVQVRMPTSRRGRHRVPMMWVTSVMPVGLCFAWKSFPDSGYYVVYPAPRGRMLEEVNGADRDLGLGTVAGSDDVSGHRPYEPGDPLSRLDWRVFARNGKLLVRALEQSSGGGVTLRWEDTAFLDNTEERLEQLSFWIMQCTQEGRTFTLILGPSYGALGSSNLIACQTALAEFGGTAS